MSFQNFWANFCLNSTASLLSYNIHTCWRVDLYNIFKSCWILMSCNMCPVQHKNLGTCLTGLRVSYLDIWDCTLFCRFGVVFSLTSYPREALLHNRCSMPSGIAPTVLTWSTDILEALLWRADTPNLHLSPDWMTSLKLLGKTVGKWSVVGKRTCCVCSWYS